LGGFLSKPFPLIGTTILVVDDERISRRVAYRLLSEEGYRVFEADGCEEALDTLSQAAGRIDLLLADVVMPECDGVTLGMQIQSQWPHIRVLYMSAYPAEILSRNGLDGGNIPFLAKPYTRDELVNKVRQTLERRSGVRRERSELPRGD
jgi:two-component system, cell cycle sensor histidine kinase and response regulator CckA